MNAAAHPLGVFAPEKESSVAAQDFSIRPAAVSDVENADASAIASAKVASAPPKFEVVGVSSDAQSADGPIAVRPPDEYFRLLRVREEPSAYRRFVQNLIRERLC
ncbi:MAG: hypothetical protein RMM53_10760 [Bacteroidia bacterium]|nr:hypothetical protein [Bacteroidia bacterium]MDW8334685.1 hypothetical protein [Bacteroidia bacterium]